MTCAGKNEVPGSQCDKLQPHTRARLWELLQKLRKSEILAKWRVQAKMRCQDLSAMNYNLIQGFIKSLLFVRIIAKASEIGNFGKMTCAGNLKGAKVQKWSEKRKTPLSQAPERWSGSRPRPQTEDPPKTWHSIRDSAGEAAYHGVSRGPREDGKGGGLGLRHRHRCPGPPSPCKGVRSGCPYHPR